MKCLITTTATTKNYNSNVAGDGSEKIKMELIYVATLAGRAKRVCMCMCVCVLIEYFNSSKIP